jgi:ATP-binding cassette subfamily F protein uup
VRLGTNREVAYFDQLRAQLDEEATLTETISPGSDWVEIGGQRIHVMSYLGRFLFAPERSRSPVRTLSGGERNRLLLARLFARPANLLVLDEPTNDLDIETLELLEELIADFPGTVLLVSHDRAFLDNVVTQTIASLGDGRWREYAGGYEDYELARSREAAAAAAAAPAAEVGAPAARALPPQPAAGDASAAPAGRAKLSYKEQRELGELPGRIARLEAEQKTLGARLADPLTYRDSAADPKALNERFAAIEAELLECLERWEALEARAG